jgi:hypothetical protein
MKFALSALSETVGTISGGISESAGTKLIEFTNELLKLAVTFLKERYFKGNVYHEHVNPETNESKKMF